MRPARRSMDTDSILILDFGGQQAQLMARKLRGERFFCEIAPCETRAEDIASRAPKGLLLAGGSGDPSAPDARTVDAGVFSLGIPVLALGFGARQMALTLGGQLLGTQLAGRTAQISFSESPLFAGLSETERFFTRVDSLELPEGFGAIAYAAGGLVPPLCLREERSSMRCNFLLKQTTPTACRFWPTLPVISAVARRGGQWRHFLSVPKRESALR